MPELSLSSYFFNAVLTWRIPCQEKMQITSPSSIDGFYKLVQEKFNLSLCNRNQAASQLTFVFWEKCNMLPVKLYLWQASSVPLGLCSRPRKGPRQLGGLSQRGAFEGWLPWVTEGLQKTLKNTAPSLIIQHASSSQVTGQKLPERRTWPWGGGRGKEGCFIEELESDHRGLEAWAFPQGLWEALGNFKQLDIAFHSFQLNNDWKRNRELSHHQLNHCSNTGWQALSLFFFGLLSWDSESNSMAQDCMARWSQNLNPGPRSFKPVHCILQFGSEVRAKILLIHLCFSHSSLCSPRYKI